MATKILFAAMLISVFNGMYHMSWKDRRVPVMTRLGPAYRTEAYRRVNIGWALFALALALGIALIFSLGS